MDLARVVDDLEAHPHRPRSFYDYPALYDFYHSRVLDREAQVATLERFRPEGTSRVVEFGCGTGPLLARIEDDYDEVLGVDVDEGMLDVARERVSTAALLAADFTEWSAADVGRTFDAAVLCGGLLHLTDDRSLESFAGNVHDSLRDGGVFVTFFEPFGADVTNGRREVRTADSERYTVTRHAVSALTGPAGRYTTTYLFEIRDEERGVETRMGTVFEGRLHDPGNLRETFADAGFADVEVVEGEGPTVLHAVR